MTEFARRALRNTQALVARLTGPPDLLLSHDEEEKWPFRQNVNLCHPPIVAVRRAANHFQTAINEGGSVEREDAALEVRIVELLRWLCTLHPDNAVRILRGLYHNGGDRMIYERLREAARQVAPRLPPLSLTHFPEKTQKTTNRMKIDLAHVTEVLKRSEDLNPEALKRILTALQEVAQEDEKETAEKEPTVKKQFVIVVSDPETGMQDLIGWVVQIPEMDSPLTVTERIHRAAYDFNTSRRGRKHPVSTVGEACEAVGQKHFKEAGIFDKIATERFRVENKRSLFPSGGGG